MNRKTLLTITSMTSLAIIVLSIIFITTTLCVSFDKFGNEISEKNRTIERLYNELDAKMTEINNLQHELNAQIIKNNDVQTKLNEKITNVNNIQSGLDKKITEVNGIRDELDKKIAEIEDAQNKSNGVQITPNNTKKKPISITNGSSKTNDIVHKYDTEAKYLAKTVWVEAGACSKTEQAAVMWCILNRVDNSKTNDIIGVITSPNQFAYRPSSPIKKELYDLAIDVLTRWEEEKTGKTDVGRVLPKEYMWFHGDGQHNHFRNAYRNGRKWDWSLPSPYDT